MSTGRNSTIVIFSLTLKAVTVRDMDVWYDKRMNPLYAALE